MPLHNYAVLKGRPIRNRLATGRSPHYQVLLSADGELYRIAINVQSQDNSEVEYLVRSRFEHPVTERLVALPHALHAVPSKPGGLALDFIRANLAQPWEFKPLPLFASGPDNDLNEKIDAFVQRAMSDETAEMYAFGEPWGPEDKADAYFGFKPGRGIHDIHFNQGSTGQHAGTNGPWQDGGLMFHFPEEQRWVAVFLKFQSQAWHTDDEAGRPHALPPFPHPSRSYAPIERDRIPALDLPDGLVRIVAAYVNDVRTPERETVTLLNTADVPVDLEGWQIKDKEKKSMRLSGVLPAGATTVVRIAQPVTLSNHGGIVTLLDARGIKVHGVAYTREQASQPGRTIPFQS